MSTESDDRQRVFETAAAMTSEEARLAYLKAACGEDLELLREIQERLRNSSGAAGLREIPTVFSPPRDDDRWSVMGDSVDGYRILDLLGEGGMGVVYRAEQTLPVRRLVALKLIKLGMDTREVVRRFESERNALALMGHPNIAQVFDAGATKDGRPYFAMELVQGTPIDEYCDRQRSSIGERLELFRQICHGVYHAHLRGVVHRDIKPSNILVTVTDGSPVVKIIDFGIAKATNQRLTERTLYTLQGQVVGTPAYMSPEQAGSSTDTIDHRTDIYSLGVLLYELLVGELPLDWESASKAANDEIVRRIRDEEPPTPSTRWSRLSVERSGELAARRGSNPAVIARRIRRELDWITMRAIAKEPGRRYATVSELEADIARYLSHEPVLARPPGTIYRVRKFARRHRGLVAGALAVTLALFVVLVAALNATLRIHQANRHAQVVVCDLYTESGIESAERGETSVALLWFANALSIPHGDPWRRRATEARFAYWLDSAAVPVHALEHGGRVGRVCFHPATTHLLTFDSEARLTIWDLSTGKLLDFVPAPREVADAAWSPSGDFLALALPDGEVEVRTFPGGAIAYRIDASPLSVGVIAFSPDGRFLALGGDGSRVWSCEAGRFASGLLDPSGTVRWLGFNARGDRLLTSSDDRKARVYGLKEGEYGPEPVFEPVPHLVQYNIAGLSQSSLQWKPMFVDGDRGVLTVETPTRVVWWDGETGTKIRTLPGRDRLLGVRPSPDGRFVAVVDQIRTRFWNIARERFEEDSIEREVVISAALWSPDSASILLAGVDETVEEWSPVPRIPARLAGSSWRRVAKMPRATATSILEYAPDGLHFATSDAGGTVRVWQRAGAIVTGFKYLPSPIVNRNIEISSDGRYAVESGREGFKPMRFARVYDLEKGVPAGPALGLAGELQASSFTPAGDLLQTASTLDLQDGASGSSRLVVLELWDWRRGKRVHAVELPSPPRISAWSADGSRLAVRCRNGDVLTISRDSGEIVTRAATDVGEDAVFAPGGAELVCWRPGEPARIRDSRTGDVRTPGFQGDVRCGSVRFSEDGARLVTVSREGATRVWDYPSLQALSPEMPHAAGVGEVDIHGELLATHSADEIVRVWRWTTAEIEGTPFRLPSTGSWIRFVGADEPWLVTFAATSGFQVWDWHAGQPILALAGTKLNDQFRRFLVGGSAILGLMRIDLKAILSKLDRRFDVTHAVGFAEVLSGQELRGGNVVSLFADQRRDRRRVGGASPSPLAFDASAEDRVAWHRRLARAFEGSWQYDAALWHSRRLGDAVLPEEVEARAGMRSWVRGWRFAQLARPWQGADVGVLDEIAPGELEAVVASARASRLERSTGPYIDFRVRYPDQNSLSLGYALRVIRSKAARRCRVLAGSDDSLRLWLNGLEVFADPTLGPAFADYRTVPLELMEGDNVLLVEVGQSGGDWGLFLRIEDEDGRPLLLTDDGDLTLAHGVEPPSKR